MNHDHAECPWQSQLTAHARHELEAGAAAALESHLSACLVCRATLADIRRMLDELAALPVNGPSRDMAPAIVQIAAAESRQRIVRLRIVRTAFAAAAAILIVAGGVVFLKNGRASESPETLAAEWLCAAQEHDGSWQAQRWGADRQFEVALTALAMRAIREADPSAWTSRHRQTLDRAAVHLVAQQADDGRFGAAIQAAPYNHALATLALLEHAHAASPISQTIANALSKALIYIVACQQADGGWGYLASGDTNANLAITAWNVQVLAAARAQGFDTAAALAQGRRWIARTVTHDGVFSYQAARSETSASPTLAAMGALCFLGESADREISAAYIVRNLEKAARERGSEVDYYRWFFLASALRQAGISSAPGLLASMRAELAGMQSRRGAAAGAWEKPDRWSRSGGTIYATAMASMAMRRCL